MSKAREDSNATGQTNPVCPVGARRLLTAAEIAEILHVPEGWVRDNTRNGRIPAVRLGRYVRYRQEAVLAWVEAQEGGGAASRQLRSAVGGGA
jgi:excisionase family DNA binding protein